MAIEHLNLPILEDLKNHLDLKIPDLDATVKEWTNFSRNFRQVSVVIQIDHKEQVSQVVRAINKYRKEKRVDITLRAAGGWAGPEALINHFQPDLLKSYRESFSFTEATVANVVLQFSEHYQKNYPVQAIRTETPEDHQVTVPAGRRIAELADDLVKLGYALPTVSMIVWVTAVGLAANSGNGTGRDQPSFTGLVTSMEVCDAQGNFRIIDETHPDFDVLRTHLGMLGVVTSVTLKCVPNFKLRETIRAYNSVRDHLDEAESLLARALSQPYCTIAAAPVYSGKYAQFVNLAWHTRVWEPCSMSTASSHKYIEPLYEHERLLEGVQDLAVDEGLFSGGTAAAVKLITEFAKQAVIGTGVSQPHVGEERVMSHYRVSFPRDVEDVSFIFPVEDAQAPRVVALLLKNIEALLLKYASLPLQREYPLAYNAYFRYIKGSDGGLSPTQIVNRAAHPDQRILILDIVSVKDAPGVTNFLMDVKNLIEEVIGQTPRYHLGKQRLPADLPCEAFLPPESVQAFREALGRWYEGTGLTPQASLFCTPELQNMVFGHAEAAQAEVPHLPHAPAPEGDFFLAPPSRVSGSGIGTTFERPPLIAKGEVGRAAAVANPHN